MIRPSIPCRCCAGSGQREIDALHFETYQQMSHSWVHTASVMTAHCSPIRQTTLIERLNWLTRAGLVEKRRDGNTMKWRRR